MTSNSSRYSTQDIKKDREHRAKWSADKAAAEKEVARVRRACRALEPADKQRLDIWTEQLKTAVEQVDKIVLEAMNLREQYPDKSQQWHDFQFPHAFYRHWNNQIRAARGSMKSTLDSYCYEAVDYPDPDYQGLVTYKKPVQYDRIHKSVAEYLEILDNTVTVLKKDLDEFIAMGGKLDTWKAPL